MGCSRVRIHPVSVKVAVLNFSVPDELSKSKELRGWWFSSRDVYQNANLGEIYADILSAELRKNPHFEVYPRTDLKYYFGRKRKRLRTEYPTLSDEQIDEIMAEISVKDVAEELSEFGVEKIVTGEIVKAYTLHNRTVHWWYSVVATYVNIHDGKTGKTEWECFRETKKNFLSQYGTAEVNARKINKRLRKTYLPLL